jgi:16S rRNA (uracil1498-N3)-methyltransferase
MEKASSSLTSARPSDSDSTGNLLHGLEYFYAPSGAITAGVVRIDGDEFAHLSHVMRRKAGDIIGVSDGRGTAYIAEITSVEKRMAIATVRSSHPMLHEPASVVVLAAALLKNPSRFDFLIEKATEIGVRSIIPLLTERTIPRHARTERWQKLALSAMKQSGRCILPDVRAPMTFDELLKPGNTLGEKRWLFHEAADGAMTASGEASTTGSHLVVIGPEGGFTDEEVRLATQSGFAAIRLGTRRLRSETAAIAAAARFLL